MKRVVSGNVQYDIIVFVQLFYLRLSKTCEFHFVSTFFPTSH